MPLPRPAERPALVPRVEEHAEAPGVAVAIVVIEPGLGLVGHVEQAGVGLHGNGGLGGAAHPRVAAEQLGAEERADGRGVDLEIVVADLRCGRRVDRERTRRRGDGPRRTRAGTEERMDGSQRMTANA